MCILSDITKIKRYYSSLITLTHRYLIIPICYLDLMRCEQLMTTLDVDSSPIPFLQFNFPLCHTMLFFFFGLLFFVCSIFYLSIPQVLIPSLCITFLSQVFFLYFTFFPQAFSFSLSQHPFISSPCLLDDPLPSSTSLSPFPIRPSKDTTSHPLSIIRSHPFTLLWFTRSLLPCARYDEDKRLCTPSISLI